MNKNIVFLIIYNILVIFYLCLFLEIKLIIISILTLLTISDIIVLFLLRKQIKKTDEIMLTNNFLNQLINEKIISEKDLLRIKNTHYKSVLKYLNILLRNKFSVENLINILSINSLRKKKLEDSLSLIIDEGKIYFISSMIIGSLFNFLINKNRLIEIGNFCYLTMIIVIITSSFYYYIGKSYER